MKVFLTIFVLFQTMGAWAFEPVYMETESFKVKTSRQYRSQNHPRFCKFETRFNSKKNVIEMRIGVVGSPVDFFGWDMPLEQGEYPLKPGSKIYKIPGVTGMIMKYDGKTLTFDRVKEENVWNRIYAFSIEINPELTKPGKFEGVMKGFERATFGGLKKHVQESCQF